ncbi:hypothetical protein LC605_01680 [Nostoc sp. CHAB 5836]|uniref:hypothetical protein n=1 Tax=Nostoc sp. CHAB 5836 TaxID=2780404 RepID=UPI001E3E7271|nr:hypothetical protein [Nostoc sp. CHAB 5836]MCC5613810.1 hypothetical protein [Nostoc sp. CHAB 5836]
MTKIILALTTESILLRSQKHLALPAFLTSSVMSATCYAYALTTTFSPTMFWTFLTGKNFDADCEVILRSLQKYLDIVYKASMVLT